MIVKSADVSDFDMYFLLKCDPVNIYWTGHADAPDKARLKTWFENRLNDDSKHIYMAYDEKESVIGYAYVDIVDGSTIESSVGILSQEKGKGYAAGLIRESLSLFCQKNKQYDTCIAWIAQDNIGSIKSYLKNEFKLSSEEKEVVFSDSTKLFNCYKLQVH